MSQTTFSQKATTPPPRTTKPTYCGGAWSARYTNTKAEVVRNGRRVSKRIHEGSRDIPPERGEGRPRPPAPRLDLGEALSDELHEDVLQGGLGLLKGRDLGAHARDRLDDPGQRGVLRQHQRDAHRVAACAVTGARIGPARTARPPGPCGASSAGSPPRAPPPATRE